MNRPRNMTLVWIALGVVAAIMILAMTDSWTGWGFGPGMMAWGGWWVFPLLFMGFMMYMMMGMGHGHGHHGHGGHGSGHGREDARAVLDRRYASGEISRAEYERIRADLEGRP